ncbi:MAG: preprotein translocase subunit SecY [Planctomycetota bacterium]
MFRAFVNVFRVPDLRKKVLFTLLLLCVYRIGFYVPLPGVNQASLSKHWQTAGGAAELAAEFFAMFTGGDLGQSTLFGLGIMPYISASIILQLLVTVVPALEKLQKEGESGRRKIMEYTRYATVGLCFVQAVFWVNYLNGNNLVYPEYQGGWQFAVMAVTGLMAGTLVLMWVGEQIDEYGIGNGVSLIIMAGIIARMPYVFIEVFRGIVAAATGQVTAASGLMGPEKVVFLFVSFVAVVAGSILITQAQRRIPIQQAKQTRGRRVVGGVRHYLPLRVNHGGVMPIIFASSFLLFPGMIFKWLSSSNIWPVYFWYFLSDAFQPGTFVYDLTYVGMVYFFAYFWVSVQFQPKELANNLRDMGSFIPGLRPGKRTADYLEAVMERITYVGAGFLAVIALIPSVVAVQLEIPYRISAFLGGTGLLIVVSVALDLIQRMEANLIMRNYEGFLGDQGIGRVKGRQY